jgi:hypothetical protein
MVVLVNPLCRRMLEILNLKIDISQGSGELEEHSSCRVQRGLPFHIDRLKPKGLLEWISVLFLSLSCIATH